MPEHLRVGLDNPVFTGRLRMPQYRQSYDTRQERPSARYFNQQTGRQYQIQKQLDATRPPAPVWSQPLSIQEASNHVAAAIPITVLPAEPEIVEPVEAISFTVPARPKQERSSVLRRQFDHAPKANKLTAWRPRLHKPQYTRLQWSLVIAAVFVFVFGAVASLQGLLANHSVTAQVAALSRQAGQSSNGSSNNTVPSTTKLSPGAFSQYMVAPDLPRYIRIPKLGVNARVLQTGVTSSGALGTPGNVYDTAWYTGSAKPGQPGATLIDGHVSSWTTRGVFYNLNKLVAGDTIQIQRGDGQVLTYQVVRSQVYQDDKVDMQAAMTPVAAGQPGLNLITCTGKVKPGTSEFNQRIVIFTKQI